MNKIDYSPVQTLLAADNRIIRTGLRQAFTFAGFNGEAFTEAGTLEALSSAIEETSFDLIIVSAELGGAIVAPIIIAMRDGRLPHHPFPIVIMLLADGNPDLVRNVAAAGADHIMLLPVAPGPMLKCIDHFVVGRMPFVVTVDYVGPDRRIAPRLGCASAPHISVPNPIAARIRNTPLAEMQSQIDLTRLELSTLKLRSYAGCLLALEKTIIAMFLHGTIDPSKLEFFARSLTRICVSFPFCCDDLCCVDVDPRTMGALSDLVADIEAITHEGPSFDPARLDEFRTNCHLVADDLKQIISGKATTSNEVRSKQA